MSKFKLINTGNTDQLIPIRHGQQRAGVMGASGTIPGRLSVPGLAKVSEGQNFIVVEEDVLRIIFGLYEMGGPGVFLPNKPTTIVPENVKTNSRLLDTGRIIVTDLNGKHVLGVGGKAYDKSVMDNLQSENAMYSDKINTLRSVLVQEGYTPEDADAILSGNKDKVQDILKKKELGVRGRGAGIVTAEPQEVKNPVDAAKEYFSDRETVKLMVGDDEVQEYKVKSMKNAMDRLIKLAADSGVDVEIGENGLLQATNAEGLLIRLV